MAGVTGAGPHEEPSGPLVDVTAEEMLETAPDAMVIVDESGRIVAVNSLLESLFGYLRDELLGQPIETLVPERLRQRHVQHVRTYFMKPAARPMGTGLDLSGRRKDGSEFPVDIRLSPLRTPKRILVKAAVRDITERKQVEAEHVRLLELALDAKLVAERAVRDREALIGIVSHDLRSPLAVIGLNAALVASSVPEAKERAESIQKMVERMANLISDLMDISRIMTTGSLPISKESLALAAIINDVLDPARPQAAQKQLQFLADIPADLPEVCCDRNRIMQVLQNLINNAFEFTPKNGTVTVSARAGEQEVILAVTDTGPGIPANQIPNLFEKYWQFKPGEGLGAGLGLSIAKGIVTGHGGKIWVESYPGKGNTFLFSLPKAC